MFEANALKYLQYEQAAARDTLLQPLRFPCLLYQWTDKSKEEIEKRQLDLGEILKRMLERSGNGYVLAYFVGGVHGRARVLASWGGIYIM